MDLRDYLAPRAPPEEGWRARFTGAGPRLREALALYEGLGLQVRLVPVDPQALPHATCASCLWQRRGLLLTLYTRPR